MKKYSVASKKLLPEYIIADTSLVQKMPSYLKACTLFDAFSQAIESFWSVNSTASSKEYSKRAIELINVNFHEYLNGEPSISRYMIEAAYYSGKAINISKTTLPHALSYFLTIKYNIPHGHAVALTLGFIGKINYNHGNENLKKVMIDICELLNIEIKDFEKHWYNLMTHSGLETRLSNLGVDRNDLGLIIDSVNVERLKNHPLDIERKSLIEELTKDFKTMEHYKEIRRQIYSVQFKRWKHILNIKAPYSLMKGIYYIETASFFFILDAENNKITKLSYISLYFNWCCWCIPNYFKSSKLSFLSWIIYGFYKRNF